MACDIEHAANAAIGRFTQAERKGYEAWLRSGGLAWLDKAVAGWEEGAFLTPDAFRTRYFGADGSVKASGLAQDFAHALTSLGPGDTGDQNRPPAAQTLVDFIRTVRLENVNRVLSRDVPPFPREFTRENIRDLAALMETEAGGSPGHAARIAVGFTVLNRMQRNGTTHVHDVWRYYRHGRQPEKPTLNEAKLVLSGAMSDPTDGATHFYSPGTMPKEGDEEPIRGDIGGGLEQVEGIRGADGKPLRNYRPSYVKTFLPRVVDYVRTKDFKFYKQPDATGKVR